MTFFRHCALLLPSAFLLGVLLFLLTHGRDDPGLGTYPFFEPFAAESPLAATPEARFLEQALVFFLPLYVVTLLFLLSLAVAETGIFGRRPARRRSPFGRAFSTTFAILFLAGTAVLVFVGERLAARYTPGALVAPILVAVAPFLSGTVALLPAALAAAPLALLFKADPT